MVDSDNMHNTTIKWIMNEIMYLPLNYYSAYNINVLNKIIHNIGGM